MKTLRVLLAEDSHDDAELIAYELRTAYRPQIERVEDADSFAAALRSRTWDVVLSDYYMPGFGALDALKLAREVDRDLPFIVVSGTVGEDLAVEAMHAGARDYVMKRNLSRLVPAIARELREAAGRRAAHAAETRLLEQQAMLEAMVRYFPGIVLQLASAGPDAYVFTLASEGSAELLEVPADTLRADSRAFFRLLEEPDATELALQLKASAGTLQPVNWEGRLRTAATATFKWINVRLTPRRGASGRVLWEGFMANITRNKAHEDEILNSRRRLSELSSHLEKAKERERERIARELHDDVGGNLSAIKMAVMWLAGRLPTIDTKAHEKADALDALVDQTAAAIVRIGQDLRPGILDLGLVAAIEWQAREFSNRTGIGCDVHLCTAPLTLERDAQTALFSVFREILTNVAKHADASAVKVDLECEDGRVDLIVSDNGRGLAAADRLKPTSFGLRGMEERAVQLGGTVSVTSVEPHGTRVWLRVPQHARTPEASFPVEHMHR